MNADQQLNTIRTLGNLDPDSYVSIAAAYRDLCIAVRELDAYLSSGGTLPEAWREGPGTPITVNRVYRFVLSDLPPTTQCTLHNGQDVLVTRAANHPESQPMWYWVESLDGARFTAREDELSPGATTPADRFAGYQS